ncbi:NADH-dependent flavin oxidoreductase yqiG-like protein, partial [Daphnia magna]
AHQPAPRPLGRQPGEPHAPGAGDRPAYPPHGRRALHPLLPPVAAGPGGRRQHLGGGSRDRPRPAGRRPHPAQHRHRLARVAGADHRHLGAPWRLRRSHRAAAQGAAHPADRQQPHQHPGAGRGHRRKRPGGPGVHGPPAAGRPAVRGQGRRRQGRRDQHLHRL